MSVENQNLRPDHEKPVLYDENGNEVEGRPEEGVAYYDKDGNELKKPDSCGF